MAGLARVFRRSLPTSCAGLGRLLVSLCLSSACLGAGWTPVNYNLEIQTHFSQSGQQHAGSVALTLEHTADVTLSVAAAGVGKEVFACQSPGSGDTLLTKFRLTGADLAAPDIEWVSSSDFIKPSRSYLVPHTDGVSQITLETQCTSSANRANDAGSYTASLIVTATW